MCIRDRSVPRITGTGTAGPTGWPRPRTTPPSSPSSAPPTTIDPLAPSGELRSLLAGTACRKHKRPRWAVLAGRLVGQLMQRLTASLGAREVLVHEAG
eukprot:15481889-Alexandrium_andersonii.AAC.1